MERVSEKLSCLIFFAMILAFIPTASGQDAREDILIANFEGDDYESWKAAGEAFGTGPAAGTLPKQMPVTGFSGQRLVNSFHNGDGTTGTLTSPPLVIQRDFIRFLIGGGSHEETRIELIINGQAVRTASGADDEHLHWQSWDVRDYQGRSALLRIVDEHTGGWGHINVDRIVQSNQPKGVMRTIRDIAIKQDYLCLQIVPSNGPPCSVKLSIADKRVWELPELHPERPQWVSWDVTKLRGTTKQLLTTQCFSEERQNSIAVVQSDEPRGPVMVFDRLYHETYRPQFHFTSARNWINDPNGLVYYKGEYHLFFQHNPKGRQWGNMTWGHAVSRDLLHWTQLAHAIKPDKLGTIFSGSAVVDWNNTAGFQTGTWAPIVAFYTSAGAHATPKVPFTQSVAYSNDRGRTWTKYEHNPVLGHISGENRDPNVMWYAAGNKWIMALFLEGNDYALFESKDLKHWDQIQRLTVPGVAECPDFFPLPVDGDPGNIRWVFWGGNGNYVLGKFDGHKFKPETKPLRSEWGLHSYAGQTWSNIPDSDGRRIFIAWMSNWAHQPQYPGMPFNQQMTFPCTMTLHTTHEGIRLFMMPVKEIKRLHGQPHTWHDVAIAPGDNPLADLTDDLLDMELRFSPGSAEQVELRIRGQSLIYDAQKQELSLMGQTAPLEPRENGQIALRVLVDRTSIEVFANDGRRVMSFCFLPAPWNDSYALNTAGGEATIQQLTVWPVRSAWASSGRTAKRKPALSK